MLMKLKRACIICLLCALCSSLQLKAQLRLVEDKLIYSTEDDLAPADTNHLFTVKEIIIEGNKQTRPATILRELTFHEGRQYPLPELVEKFAEAKRQLMNTALFHEVVVSLKSLQDYDALVKIEVKERWYIFPFPFIRTVDRSFGEWVKEQNMDMDRVNYGVKITHNNISGRNDKLQLNFTNGYTKQFSLAYKGLILDKNQQWTSSFGFALGKNRQLNYITEDNKRLFYKDDRDYVHSFCRSFVELSYRRAIKTKHTFGISYNTESVPDTVLKINPSFFPDEKVKVRYPEFYYNLSHFNVDYIPYPTKGYAADITLRKRGGFNKEMNLWQLGIKTSASWPVGSKYYFNVRTAGMIKVPFKQPFVNQQLLGFDNMFMQGYEYYVVDGVAGGYTKATFARQILNTNIHIRSDKVKKLNNIPLRIYAKVYGNTGYVYNKQAGDNELNNRMLYSAGVGLDVITFYDFIIRLEWSFNQLGQNDIYLHRKNYF